jgi:FAD/FMN-containing dehydrogenase
MNYLEHFENRKRLLVKEFKSVSGGVALAKSTSNLFRHRKGKRSGINVRNFNHVLAIDIKKKIADVEGMTTYEELVNATLKHGLMPTVVPELKSITIGGALTGVGIESSSFKYGLVHETITEVEVLLANGDVVVCTSSNKHKDLFFGFPNSYGTLGYALRLKVKLVPVKKYVKLTHLKFPSFKSYFEKMRNLCKNKKFDFIDGAIFNKKEMYITLGEFVNEADFVSDYKGMKIYYQSLRKKKVDYLKVLDYIWRWDTDWFWCSKHFGVQNKLFRMFIPKKYLNSITYSKIRTWNGKYKLAEKIGKLFGNKKVESVVQDVEVPLENCEKFMNFFHDVIGIKPVWVCPIQTYNRKVSFDLYPMNSSKLYMNFGFWDVVKTSKKDGYYNREIEKKVLSLNGKKSLYSTSFYSEKEFWKLYSKSVYNKLKKKYDPKKRFLNLYEKCVKRL